MQTSAMYRMMATLSGIDALGVERFESVAQLAWLTHLTNVCSNCGVSRSKQGWDEMWGTCAPCGRKMDCGSENSALPPECRECFCGSCG